MRLFERAVRRLSREGRLDKLSDKAYVRLMYRTILKRRLNLKNPKTLNEKLQWIKLYDHRPEYTMMVDKYAVREYIKKELGEEYLIPLLGVWEDPEQIDFDALPEQFVLKCNHNSGVGMCICKDKSKLDIAKVKRNLQKGLQQNYYLSGREWPYKNVKPCIIAEKYMTDSSDVDVFTDYKFYCFDGHVDSVLCCVGRSEGNVRFYYFDKNWELQDYLAGEYDEEEAHSIPKPEQLEQMLHMAQKLSKGIPHVRVDLYISCDKIYFGELTFFTQSGFDTDISYKADLHWGSLLNLDKIK